MIKYEPVIGIEIHAQLNTKTKLFCGCSTTFGDHPNSNVCPVCLGLPGALPVLSKKAVEMAITAGLALNCTVRPKSVFSRKNYFYPDLPKGYQISQFDLPICEAGYLDIELENSEKRIGITRIHMEEDAGKLVHQNADSIAGATHSIVDLNRACTPLIEIVSEPDIRSAKEARAYVEKVRLIVQHMGICDGNMEQGNLRADANVSLRPVGQVEFGTRAEIKNLNSFRSIERAVNVEIARQTEILNSNGTVIQETRNYDDNKQQTSSLRSKEEAHDYRYFPEPDLPPLVLPHRTIEEIKQNLPEMPDQKKQRYQSEYGFTDQETKILLQDIETDAFFNTCISKGKLVAKDVYNWVVGEVTALNKEANLSMSTSPITPDRLVELLLLIKDGTVSGKMAKDLLVKVISEDKPPKDLIESSGGAQISDSSELENIVRQVLSENPDVVEKIKGGKTASANFLMGQVMKATKGRAKPDVVLPLILKLAAE